MSDTSMRTRANKMLSKLNRLYRNICRFVWMPIWNVCFFLLLTKQTKMVVKGVTKILLSSSYWRSQSNVFMFVVICINIDKKRDAFNSATITNQFFFSPVRPPSICLTKPRSSKGSSLLKSSITICIWSLRPSDIDVVMRSLKRFVIGLKIRPVKCLMKRVWSSCTWMFLQINTNRKKWIQIERYKGVWVYNSILHNLAQLLLRSLYLKKGYICLCSTLTKYASMNMLALNSEATPSIHSFYLLRVCNTQFKITNWQ